MPNRIIKDSIAGSEKVNSLTDFQFRLWVGLITYVDDYGRGDARPAIIRGSVFPLRDRVSNQNIRDALLALASAGCVGLYESDGRPYLYFPHWERHQRIQNRRSKFPAPDGSAEARGESPSSTEDHGEPPPESNPNPNTDTNTNTEPDPYPDPKEDPKEKKKAKEKDAAAPSEPARPRGAYGWVKLTDREYGRLLADLGREEAERCIAYVDESAQATGNKNRWKDWNLTLRRCSRDGWGLKGGARPGPAPAPAVDLAALEKQLEKL